MSNSLKLELHRSFTRDNQEPQSPSRISSPSGLSERGDSPQSEACTRENCLRPQSLGPLPIVHLAAVSREPQEGGDHTHQTINVKRDERDQAKVRECIPLSPARSPRTSAQCILPPPAPLVITIPLPPKTDPEHILRVTSNGKRGVPLTNFAVEWVDGAARVTLQPDTVDWIDVCICPSVWGPTIRVASVGEEWPESMLRLPGFPVLFDKGRECITFGFLVRLAVEQFLTWWMLEKEKRIQAAQLDRRVGCILGPGAIELEKVHLVAIRRCHIALGVYEWFAQIEVRL